MIELLFRLSRYGIFENTVRIWDTGKQIKGMQDRVKIYMSGIQREGKGIREHTMKGI